MATPHLVPLDGSRREAVEGARHLGPADPSAPIRLSIQLASREPEQLAARIAQPGYAPYTHEEFEQAHAPAPDTVETVRGYLESHNLSVAAVSSDRRSLSVTGTVADAERAFGTQLHAYEADGRQFRARSGQLAVPAELAPLIEGVFGLDTRPFASPHFRRPTGKARGAAVPLTALQVAAAYQFPSGDGAGQTIGLVELGGGYQDADLQTYFAGLGLATPSVTAVGVQGGQNQPGGDPQGADGEVELDIEVAGAIAPAARIVVYFAKDASEQSFVDVLNAIVNDATNAPAVVSISWGGPELQATAAARSAMDSALQAGAGLGITFLVAAGDNGTADQPGGASVNVDYPASSPYVTGCGGTELVLSNGAVASEVVWNEAARGSGATGGGISAVYPVPAWQQGVSLPASLAANSAGAGRGVPDVAGNADPQSGYRVQVDGQAEPIGGTSAVAPLWAGLIARINSTANKRLGFLNPVLYQAKGEGFNDITAGDNGIPAVPGYAAGPGWDACTGWGSPNGAQLAAILSKA
ncbi:MAG TPA: S53 family peptidase [Chloroflexota bacterium]|nr:S53 family peptidase [Chloroflexota bacterium]